MAVAGETAASMALAIIGSSKRVGVDLPRMSTSWGSRVRLDGTMATSSNP